MRKATKQSSRKRMECRINRYVKAGPCLYYRLHPKTQEEVQCANRAMRRKQAARAP